MLHKNNSIDEVECEQTAHVIKVPKLIMNRSKHKSSKKLQNFFIS